ncbi:MAG: DegT/DnrJ/EryC1/StrS family aminotransferase [Clostridia bacterium]|nr:DegT/DnrJ/EryC1/StrS family aminotransferase [Clostridia bacterium]
MPVPSNRLDLIYFKYKREFDEKAVSVLSSNRYILGPELEAFEREFAAASGARRCVGVACGLDALKIAMHVAGVGPGDEVIVQANTFIAGPLAVSANGATPVFVDVGEDFAMSPSETERAITPATKAVLVTHLFGLPTPMEPFVGLCEKHGLALIEDCAQAHGSKYKGRPVGTFGHAGCFSFYPTKTLGGFGDGGGIITDLDDLADRATVYRNYGSEKKYYNREQGVNSRLDELQAGLLRVKLKHFDELLAERAALAGRYLAGINNPLIRLPSPAPGSECAWHQFVIRCGTRDRLAQYLRDAGIGTEIHFPVPVHLSEAYKELLGRTGKLPVAERLAGEILSLPFFNGLTYDEQSRVIKALNAYQTDPTI